MIKVSKLTKKFGEVTAIENMSFEVEKGEIVGFLGPNAAGKTTTMRILSCFFPPSSGTANIAGYDVLEDSIDARRCIGYIPENIAMYSNIKTKDYLIYVAQLKGISSKKEAIQRTCKIMERCGVTDVGDVMIQKLSKGYKQRIGLAQALVNDPPVLILDEPTVGLDPKQIIQVRQLIKNLAGEHTIILSSHILPEVNMTCERIIIINKGKVVAVDTPNSLAKKLSGVERIYMEVCQDASHLMERISKWQGVVCVESAEEKRGFYVETVLHTDLRSDLARVAVNNGFDLVELSLVDMTLEDVFLSLTTEEVT